MTNKIKNRSASPCSQTIKGGNATLEDLSCQNEIDASKLSTIHGGAYMVATPETWSQLGRSIGSAASATAAANQAAAGPLHPAI